MYDSRHRSTPHELFGDLIEELEVKYEADKKTIEEALEAKVRESRRGKGWVGSARLTS